MKNLSLILNGVLIVAVAVLYFFQFKGPVEDTNPVEETTAQDLGPLTVAYVNSDTLISNYELFKEKQESLDKKRVELESQYQTRTRGLESEIASYQRTRSSMTIGQARAVEEDLQNKQQNLIMYRDQLGQTLVIEENNAQTEIYEKISEFLDTYSKDNNYHVVLSYQRGSGVLFANQSLEITNDVITGLNEAYNLEKTGGTVPKDSIQ